MKIAVTYENGEVFQHFGHTENFKIYTIKDGAVSEAHVEPTQGSGHSALAGFLAERNVDALICGGIGQGAKNALAQAGITLYGGVVGKADDAVRALLNGTLVYDGDATCSHREHEGGQCGSHDNCGGHDGCASHGCRG